MIKLISRNWGQYETGTYLRFGLVGYPDDDGNDPNYGIIIPIPSSSKVTEIDRFDHFEQSAVSSRGLEMESVSYQRNEFSRTHTYNPVTHYKLEGTVLADEDTVEQVVLPSNHVNRWTGRNREAIIPLPVGGRIFRTATDTYPCRQIGDEADVRFSVEVSRSGESQRVLVKGQYPCRMTYVTYRCLVYNQPKGKRDRTDNIFYAYSGCVCLPVGTGAAPPGQDYTRNRVYYNDVASNEATVYRGSYYEFDSIWSRLGLQMSNDRRKLVSYVSSHTPAMSIADAWKSGRVGNAPYGPIHNRLAATKASLRTGVHNQSTLTRLASFNWAQYEHWLEYGKRVGEWNDLSHQALQNIGDGAQVNGIAYVKDAIGMSSTVKKFAATLRSIPSKKVKAVASAWLAVHYGFKLMILDTKELYEELKDSKHSSFGLSNARSMRRVYDSKHAVSVEYRYQIIYDRYRNLSDTLNGFLREVDFVLNLRNVWDMVPFSFIVDWFTKVGDMFNSIDGYYNVRSYYTTAAAGQSIKATGPLFADSSVTDSSAITFTMYKRAYKATVESPIPSNTTVTPLSHWVEAAALIIANR